MRKTNIVLRVDAILCMGCGVCIGACPSNAINLIFGKAHIYQEKCIRCMRCTTVCPQGAIKEIKAGRYSLAQLGSSLKDLRRRMDALKAQVESFRKKLG